MPYSIHRYNNTSEVELQAIVVNNQVVTIGAEDSADLQLVMTIGMPEVCVSIWSEGDLLIAENMIRQPGLIFLNEVDFSGTVQLQHGDILQIGHDQFAVVYDSQIAEPEDEVVEAPIRRVFESYQLNSALAVHSPVDIRWSELDFLERLCEEHGAFLFANYRFAGLPEPNPEIAGDDLYSESPAEVRESYSLHAVSQASTSEKFNAYESLHDKDAAIWVVPESDPETTIEDAKLHLAWFSRPSVLAMTLDNSQELFCESLLKPFKAIIIKSGNSTAPWTTYTKTKFDPTQLGICENSGETDEVANSSA